MTCKYCESRLGGACPLIHDPKNISFFEISEINENGGILELSGPKGDAQWPIKYCPECGEKLKCVSSVIDRIMDEMNGTDEIKKSRDSSQLKDNVLT